MIKLYKLEEKLPEPEQVVLVKYKSDYHHEDVPYYVCRYTESYSEPQYVFREAEGELYMEVEWSEIEGWAPIEELDKVIEVGE